MPLTSVIAEGPCPLKRFFSLALALVDILDHIHHRQIIHRDLKPSNIVINPQTGRVQLIDFGLASRLSREHPQLTLALVSEQSEEATEAALWPTLQIGLLTQHETTYRFLHDRVQETAYGLTPTNERAAIHARIGRLLRDQSAAAEQETQHFTIVTHLNSGATLLTDSDERRQVAALNLRAGIKAQAATVYTAACGFLAAGMEYSPPTPGWSITT